MRKKRKRGREKKEGWRKGGRGGMQATGRKKRKGGKEQVGSWNGRRKGGREQVIKGGIGGDGINGRLSNLRPKS